MRFRDRSDAGKLLAQELKEFKDKNTIIYALPRGGVVPAYEVASYLSAPLELVISRKISHPTNPEFAIAAVSESGYVVGDIETLLKDNKDWLIQEINKQKREITRRRKEYMLSKHSISPKGKIAIIVDDGAATGLSVRAAIKEIQSYNPKLLVVAIPIIPQFALREIYSEVDEIISLHIPSSDQFLGAVGAYYDDFSQVQDEEVIDILNKHKVLEQRKIVESKGG